MARRRWVAEYSELEGWRVLDYGHMVLDPLGGVMPMNIVSGLERGGIGRGRDVRRG